MDLVVEIYRATEPFPKSETFGLTNQLRRASVSISSNIAEGQGRSTTKDFCHFLYMARGSLQEVETQILIAGNGIKARPIGAGRVRSDHAAAAEGCSAGAGEGESRGGRVGGEAFKILGADVADIG